MCPVCHASFEDVAGELRCTGCSTAYGRESEIPILASDESLQNRQASWFNEAVDEDFEISRPHGTPRLYRWLLAEKFRRATVDVELEGATALSVCAGSGMDAEFLARLGATVVAADISIGAARRTQHRAARYGLSITPIVADVERLPFEDSSFDVVAVHDGLHHLEDPERGLREMARVAKHAVCISEPADARATAIAVSVGLALEREDAGNRVERMRLDRIEFLLCEAGFRIKRAERYAMLYRHSPGLPMYALSLPGVFTIVRALLRAGNALAGRFGNKLVVVGVKS